MSHVADDPLLEDSGEPQALDGRQLVTPALACAGLVLVSRLGYGWFHSLVELFTVVVGVALYLVARRTFAFSRNAYLLCVAGGFFWSSCIDIFHTLTYEGMPNGVGLPPDAAPLFWLCARSVQALAMLVAPRYLDGRAWPRGFFGALGALSAGLVLLVFLGDLPTAFIPGQGLTAFKIGWEWLIVVLYAAAAWQLHLQRQALDPKLQRVMLGVFGLLIGTELCFTNYHEMSEATNLVGHLLKLWAYWLMLWVVSHHMLEQPRRLLRERTRLLIDVTSRMPGLAFQLERSAQGEFRFGFVSSGAAEIFELTPAEAQREAELAFRRLPAPERTRLRAALEDSLQAGSTWKGEWQVRLPRRGLRWHAGEFSVPTRRADGAVLWIGVISDCTERKQMELELTQHRDHLAALVDEQTQALRQTTAQAQQSSRVKTEFLSNMSHEVRTPLNAIMGLAQLGLRDPQAGGARRYLEQIHDSSQLLLSLVNDILDVAKIEAGKMVLEQQPFRLTDVTRRIRRLTAHRAQLKGLDFIVETDPTLPAGVFGDELRLTQVLLNLVGNAIKFTERGHVRLKLGRIGTAAQPGLMIVVEDTGIGMQAEQTDRLFLPFEQADASTTRRYGGTGLGLTICKHIVDAMGGQLFVSSRPGHGSCFTLTLPCREADPPASSGLSLPDAERPLRLRGLRVLAAEDEPVNQWLLREWLEHEGATCEILPDGAAALAALERDPDRAVLLTDVQMPVLDGYETARQVRRRWPRLPVIGLTAHAQPEERQRCLDAGMDEHVTKPVDIDVLCGAILRVLAQRAAPTMAPAVAPAVVGPAAPTEGH